MKRKYIFILLFIIGVSPLMSLFSMAQVAARAMGQEVIVKVVTAGGEVIENATVWANNGGIRVKTGADGSILIRNCPAGELLIEAEGYEDVTVMFRDQREMIVVLPQAPVFSGEKDMINLPNAVLPKRRVVGAVSTIKSEDIEISNEINMQSALVGKADGLFVFKGTGTPGVDNISMYVRGRSRGGSGDGPRILIDGIPNRDLSALTPSEIESIEVLKDITAKMLYGSFAANGVIMVTTKRGTPNKRIANFSVDYGIKTPTVLPEYLNSFNYATLYNEARRNDGLEDYYSQEALDGYESGSDPLLYPDVDYYSYFLKPSSNFKRVFTEFSGGSEHTRYYLNLGYAGEGPSEAFGDGTRYHRLNVRGNLDYRVNDIVSMSIDISGFQEMLKSHNMTPGVFFSELSSARPNDYPIFIKEHQSVDSMMLGWSAVRTRNLYGDLTQAGFLDKTDLTVQTGMGMAFNLEKFVQGLSAKVNASYDTWNYLAEGKTESYPRYRTDNTQVGTRTLQSSLSNRGNNYNRNFGAQGSVDYSRTFDRNAITSNLVFIAQRYTARDYEQDLKRTNLGWRLNYAYDNKYIAEIDASLMGSYKFTKENRYGLFPSAGVAWVISEEDFMSGVSLINFLKLKASFGIMGYDYSFADRIMYDAYRNVSSVTLLLGSYNFGIDNAVPVAGRANFQAANPLINFEKSREYNVGLEGLILNNTLFLEANYFNEFRYDMPVTAEVLYPDYFGGAKPVTNFEEVKNHGLELSANYRNKAGNFHYSFGGNLSSVYSEYVTVSEVVAYDWQKQTGNATDAIRGYVNEGFYMSEADITSYGVNVSSLGDIKPGDLKYKDLNGDGIINGLDQQIIGNSFPRLYYGMNLKMEYKGVGLIVFGQGVSGLHNTMNNTYYRNYGEGKYSVEALGRWTSETSSTATYPRLTTQTSAHSHANSSFWLQDVSFFKLRNVELSFTLPENIANRFFVKDMKFFTRGSDLFTISKVKKSDPESISAGVTNYPMYRTISGGIKLGF